MARTRQPPGAYACIQAAVRALGWFNAVAAVVVLAFIPSRWHDMGVTVAAGIAGVSTRSTCEAMVL